MRSSPSFVVPVGDFVQDSVCLHSKTSSCACLPAGSSALGLLLGPEGDFVREMLIEELAKGVDAALRTTLDDAIAGTRQRLVQLLGVSGADRVCCSDRVVAGNIPWASAARGHVAHAAVPSASSPGEGCRQGLLQWQGRG